MNLTARQLDIIKRVAMSQPQKQIASDLGVKPKVVEYHLGCKIRMAVGARDRAAVTRFAVKYGLIRL